MPVAVARPCATTLPSAIISLASIARLKENASPGSPFTASGFGLLPPLAVVSGAAGVQVCVMVSGLNWKITMFGRGIRNVGMNCTKAPCRYLPGISERPPQLPYQVRDYLVGKRLQRSEER